MVIMVANRSDHDALLRCVQSPDVIAVMTTPPKILVIPAHGRAKPAPVLGVLATFDNARLAVGCKVTEHEFQPATNLPIGRKLIENVLVNQKRMSKVAPLDCEGDFIKGIGGHV